MGLYMSLFFLLHVFMFYLYSFRFLKFLISVEISLIMIYVCVKILVNKKEVTFLLLFLAIIACEAAVGLALLVSWVRFEDKFNVKSHVFSSF